MEKFKFIPATGFKDSSAYPEPNNETEVREQLQRPLDQLADYVNNNIVTYVDEQVKTIQDGLQNVSQAPLVGAESVFKELFIENLGIHTISRVVVYRAYYSTNGYYYSSVRVEFDGTTNKYIEFKIRNVETQAEADELFEQMKHSIMECSRVVDGVTIKGYALLGSLDGAEYGKYKRIVPISINDVTTIESSPSIVNYFQNHYESKRVVYRAVKDAINGKNAYQAPHQFMIGSKVDVYVRGSIVDPSEYTLLKQGKVVFNHDVDYLPEEVSFEYDLKSVPLPLYENDLSSNVMGFNYYYDGTREDSYSFVDNPNGSGKVIKLSCTSSADLQDHQERESGTSTKSDRLRIQFDRKPLNLTELVEEVDFYLPSNVASAILTCPWTVDWFSLWGAWTQYGDGTSGNMHTGSSSNIIVYHDIGSNDLFYLMRCRLRNYDRNTGAVSHTIMNKVISTFKVKTDEWIHMKRTLVTGNRGYFKLEITDSDGYHVIDVPNAVVGLPDPERETERYGDKVASDIPYRAITIASGFKMYVRSDIAKHIIDNAGEVTLYYKDFKVLEQRATNVFEAEKVTTKNNLYLDRLPIEKKQLRAEAKMTKNCIWTSHSANGFVNGHYRYADRRAISTADGRKALEEEIKDLIDMGVEEIYPVLYINRNGSSFYLSGGDSFIKDLIWLKRYFDGKIVCDTIRIIADTSTSTILTDAEAESYKTVLGSIMTKLPEYKKCIVINELESYLETEKGIQFAKDCVDIVHSAGMLASISMSNRLIINDELLDYIDFFACNLYQPVQFNTEIIVNKSCKNAVLNASPIFEYLNRFGKDIVISECGCRDCLWSLGNPASSTVPEGLYNYTNGKAIAHMIDGVYGAFGNMVTNIAVWYNQGFNYHDDEERTRESRANNIEVIKYWRGN